MIVSYNRYNVKVNLKGNFKNDNLDNPNLDKPNLETPLQTYLRVLPDEFRQGISPLIAGKALTVLEDIALDSTGKEILDTPLSNALGQRFTRFGHKANPDKYGVAFLQESGEVWQVKVFSPDIKAKGKTGQYLAPKGIGNRAYLPPLEGGLTWEKVLDDPTIPLTITEGGKKALVGISYGLGAVASVYGCRCGKSPDLLPYYKGRQVIVAYDRDPESSPKAKKAVRRGIYETCLAIKAGGGSPYVWLWDGKQGKGLDDALISTQGKILEQRELISFELWKVNNNYNGLSRYKESEIKVNQSELKVNIPNTKLVAIKSPKGTGKTKLVSQIVQERIVKGEPTIWLTHRVKLAQDASNKNGLPYKTDKDDDSKELKDKIGYCLCIHSLTPYSSHKFLIEHWRDKKPLVVIDEVEQLIWSLLNESTIRNNRGLIIHNFRELIKCASQVIIMDADLTDTAIQFIEGLLDKPLDKSDITLINNTYQTCNKSSLTVFTEKEQMLEELRQVIRNKEAERDERAIFITTGAMKCKSAYGTKNLETILENEFPRLRIIRIDSESISNPEHPAFECTEIIEDRLHGYDVIITSPTLETGISLEASDTYHSVWCYANGTLTVNGVSQAMARVRENVPRYLYAKDKHNIYIADGSDSAYTILDNQYDLHDINYHLLRSMGTPSLNYSDYMDGNNGRTVFKTLLLRGIFLETWAKHAALINAQARCYRESILAKLLKENYQLVEEKATLPLSESKAKEVRKQVKEITKLAAKEECESIAKRECITNAEASDREEKQVMTLVERQELEKHNIGNFLCTESPTSEQVEQVKYNKWGSKLILHYYATVGNEYLDKRDTDKLTELNQGNVCSPFIPDFNKVTLTPKIKCLEILGIDKFLDTSQVWSNDNLLDWFTNRVLPCRRDIKLILGLTVSEKYNPISFVQKLLGLLGLKLVGTLKRKGQGVRVREYRLQPPTDGREDVFSLWVERDAVGLKYSVP